MMHIVPTQTRRLALAAAFTALALPAFANPASVLAGAQLGTEPAAIVAALEARGWMVRGVDIDDVEIDVKFLADGRRHEVEVSRRSGLVTEVGIDD
jgi:hypothetical protein